MDLGEVKEVLRGMSLTSWAVAVVMSVGRSPSDIPHHKLTVIAPGHMLFLDRWRIQALLPPAGQLPRPENRGVNKWVVHLSLASRQTMSLCGQFFTAN